MHTYIHMHHNIHTYSHAITTYRVHVLTDKQILVQKHVHTGQPTGLVGPGANFKNGASFNLFCKLVLITVKITVIIHTKKVLTLRAFVMAKEVII